LRWRIETIFKAWKSHFRLTEVPRGSAAQLEAMIYARLIFVTIFARTGVVGEGSAWQAESPPPFSLLKLAGLVGDFFLILCLEAWHRPVSDSWLRQLHYHGRYERRTRKHFVQTFMKLS
jgi:Transposase DDE domain.